MAEANEAEPNERAAPSPRRPRRKHVISLCCAQSVHRVVEEVARNLEGLGFTTAVVTGAEARAALLGSRTDSAQPTIHVVCVQGSMQERLLKPLRQALATHGGPNHHLFVAVLDLGVPLAMVGQIRRFAEALERPASGSHPAAVAVEREPSAGHRDLEQSPTRSYPTVAQVVERGGTKPPAAPEGEGLPRRTRPLGLRPPVAKIGPTSKYQAVTASNAAVPEPGVHKRRRARSRMSPAAPRRVPEKRVLGLPEPEQNRQPMAPRVQPPPAPLPPSATATQPPPPPAPGELARRRSAAASAAGSTPPPPPPTKTPSSTSLPAADGEAPSSTRRAAGEAATPERQTSPYLRRVEGKPSEPGAAAARGSAEPDRPVPRPEGNFRFTPPGAKAAEDRRPQGVAGSSVPLSEVLSDSADRTMVQGVLAEVPRTASTLRLDEPPFADGAKPRGRVGAASEDDEPVEPTMIITAPRGTAGIEVDEEEIEPSARGKVRPVPPASIVGTSPLPPAATGTTVVGPPPKPTPEALAELERVRREVGGAAARAEPGPRKTVGYLQREEAGASDRTRPPVSESSRTLARPMADSESSGTLVLRARTSVTVDDEELLHDSASTLVQRPRGAAAPSGGPSGTLVLRPQEGEAKPSSESSGTVVLERRAPAPPKLGSESSGTMRPKLGSESSGTMRPKLGSESSGTAVLERRAPEPPKLGSESSGTMRPKPGSESSGTMRPRLGDAARVEGPSGTVVQPAPTAPVSESEKTLLRSDGTFENSRDLMGKIEASRRAPPAAATPTSGTKAAPPPAPAAPGDPQAAFKAGKTVLYADSAALPLPAEPAEGGTVVGAPPRSAGPSAAPASEQGGTVVAAKPSAAPASEQGGTVVAAKPSAAPASSEQGGTVVAAKPAPRLASRESEPDAPVLTARSPSGRKVPQSAVPTERHPLADGEPDGKPSRRTRGKKREIPRSSEQRPSSSSGVLESSAPSTREQPRPRDTAPRPRTKSSASRYGWLWITLVLLAAGGGWGAYQAGLFGGRSGTTIADAGTTQPSDPSTPSDTAARTSAGEAGAAEAGADAAEAGNAEAGVAEAGAAEAGAAEAGAAEAGAAEAGAAEAGAAEAGAADAGAADGDAGTTGPTPKAEAGDDDSTTGGPEPAADSAGTPDQPSDTRGPDQPTADDGTPDQPPTTGGTPDPPPTTGGDPEPTPGDGPKLSAEEQTLQPAVDQRRVFMLKTLYTTRRQGEETSFGGAWQRCAKLEVDGVTRWRLPHRREMKLVNAVLNLPSGVYWTRTVPQDDKSSAYVLDTSDGSLALFQKSEPIGDVVCVRERDFPEK